MYKGFFGILILTALVAAHCIYLWRGRSEKRPMVPKSVLARLLIAAGLYAAAVVAGLVIVLTGSDATISHAMGILALLFALWFDSMFGRVCGTAESLKE